MTWWTEEDSRPESMSSGTRARQRWEQLHVNVLQVVGDPPVGARFASRWIMSGWQVWRRLDRDWCEYVCDAKDRDDALNIVNFSIDDSHDRK